MADSELDAGVDPVTFGADEWLARLAALPLAFQPGEGWHYHHSFGILGTLIARVAGRPLQDHLADDLLGPLGLRDTGLWVSAGSVARLPASYRHTDSGLVELEPAAGGFYAGHPPFDVSHGELVSTVRDYSRFARMLADGGRAGRYGWSGGLGTNFFVDPDGTVGVLLTQVEMGERMQVLLDEFQALPEAA